MAMSDGLLRLSEVLGINKRNRQIISDCNRRKDFPLVDDKIRTKEILTEAGVACPETLAVAGSFIEIGSTIKQLESEPCFVVKPSRGRAGGGILLLEKVREGYWKTPSGRMFNRKDLAMHMANIMFGVYSFGSTDDRVLIEKKIVPTRQIVSLCPAGIPDIRIIVYRNIPVMAMARIPTSGSDGKANLHQGAIGAAVNIETGELGSAVCMGKILESHPDSGAMINGMVLNDWGTIRDTAVRASETVPLGYLGIDIVTDENKGPLVLEMNARPGLQIQVVNGKGLVPLLKGCSIER